MASDDNKRVTRKFIYDAWNMAAHPFFVAILFVPQARSAPGRPHPTIRPTTQ